MRTSGNTILITGGATGIGLALARALLQRGNEVIICGWRRERFEEARTENPALHVRVADVADERARRERVARIRGRRRCSRRTSRSTARRKQRCTR